MHHDLHDIWDDLCSELRRAVPESTFEIWLAPLRPLTLADDTLAVEAPAGIRSLVAQRFGRLLDATASAVVGAGTVVRIDQSPPSRLDERAPRGSTGRTAERTATRERRTRGERGDDAPRRVQPGPPEPLNPKFTFEQFVIGDANRMAHAAALAVAELPGQAYNPLFLYGPPGVGKTHLLHAIGNYIRRYGAGLTVRCTTVERFTNEFLGALHGGDVDAFKAHYRRNDVLLIDDVQFLEQKAKTEEEFFHTFNALHDMGSQLVFTSDRLPGDLDALHDRLRERFASGLVADISAPDPATRMGVLRKRAQHDGLALPDDGALEVIAGRITSNVRALEGALIRVVAFASLEDEPISAELAARVLDTLYPQARKTVHIDVRLVQDLVCDAFSLSREELLSDDRSARVSWPRQLAMYLAREHTDATLPAIGRSFGGKNHTTVLYAVRRTTERLAQDPDVLATVSDLARRLTDGWELADADRAD
ncbi:chromosomal replication initiator protein DnaA [Paraconexibacter sp.]|uniref:chromosomal replication initiator protein DnaA n=1 Tax=Paraconexibacter sp. TaxID=2949640 RepID=UPI003567C971